MRVPRSKVFALTGSVVVGALVTLQTAINGELAHRLGSGARAGVLAAVISFGTGLVVLTIALLVLPSWRAQLRRLHRTSTLARWKLLGGTAGALLVASRTVPAMVWPTGKRRLMLAGPAWIDRSIRAAVTTIGVPSAVTSQAPPGHGTLA